MSLTRRKSLNRSSNLIMGQICSHSYPKLLRYFPQRGHLKIELRVKLKNHSHLMTKLPLIYLFLKVSFPLEPPLDKWL